jgi:hypothetical protein
LRDISDELRQEDAREELKVGGFVSAHRADAIAHRVDLGGAS